MAPADIESSTFRTLILSVSEDECVTLYLKPKDLRRFYVVVEVGLMDEFSNALHDLPQSLRVKIRLCGEAFVDGYPVVAHC